MSTQATSAFEPFGKIDAGAVRLGFALQPDARRYDALTVAVVQSGSQEQDFFATLLVVVRHLQKRNGLACVHRRVPEPEAGQWKSLFVN
jgi:hypothetical protein